MDTSKIKLLNSDLLIQPENQPNQSIIHVIENRNKDANHFKVIRVSDKVRDISVGDTILVKFGDHIPVFLIGDEYFTVTSEELVLAVIES